MDVWITVISKGFRVLSVNYDKRISRLIRKKIT